MKSLGFEPNGSTTNRYYEARKNIGAILSEKSAREVMAVIRARDQATKPQQGTDELTNLLDELEDAVWCSRPDKYNSNLKQQQAAEERAKKAKADIMRLFHAHTTTPAPAPSAGAGELRQQIENYLVNADNNADGAFPKREDMAADIMELVKAHDQATKAATIAAVRAALPTKRIVQDDDDLKNEYDGKALQHEIQENNISYGFNDAIDQMSAALDKLEGKDVHHS